MLKSTLRFVAAMAVCVVAASDSMTVKADDVQHWIPTSPFQNDSTTEVVVTDQPTTGTVTVVPELASVVLSVPANSERFVAFSVTALDLESGTFTTTSVVVDTVEDLASITSDIAAGGAVARFDATASTWSGGYLASKIIFKGDPEDVKTAEEMLEELKKDAPKEVLDKIKEIEDAGITIIVVDGDPRVIVGDYDGGRIDIADMDKFPEGGGAGTKESTLLHELVEQFEKQINKAPYKDAHEDGIKAEEVLTGSDRQKQLPPVRNADGTITVVVVWVDKDGKKIHQEIVIDPTTGNVISVTNKPQP